MVLYLYGLRLRPLSLGCVPKNGFLGIGKNELNKGEYYDLAVFDRELKTSEIEDYELEFVKKVFADDKWDYLS